MGVVAFVSTALWSPPSYLNLSGDNSRRIDVLHRLVDESLSAERVVKVL